MQIRINNSYDEYETKINPNRNKSIIPNSRIQRISHQQHQSRQSRKRTRTQYETMGNNMDEQNQRTLKRRKTNEPQQRVTKKRRRKRNQSMQCTSNRRIKNNIGFFSKEEAKLVPSHKCKHCAQQGLITKKKRRKTRHKKEKVGPTINDVYTNYQRNIPFHKKVKKFKLHKDVAHKVITWNVDGYLRAGKARKGKRHRNKDKEEEEREQKAYGKLVQIKDYVQRQKPMVVMVQEAYGTKGTGYRETVKKENIHNISDSMCLATHDKYGATAVFVHESIEQFVPIPFSDQIYEGIEGKNKIHASAVVLMMDKKIRNRNQFVFLSVYRSPNAKAVDITQFQKILDAVYYFLKDKKPNIYIGGDLNFWSEQIGSDPDQRKERKKKFEDGDKMFELMHGEKNRCINMNSGEPTLWKWNKEKTERKYYACDSYWLSHQTLNFLQMETRNDNTVFISDHFPNIATMSKFDYHKRHKTKRLEWNIEKMNEEKWEKLNMAMEGSMAPINHQMEGKEDDPATIHSAMQLLSEVTVQNSEAVVGRKTKQVIKPWIDEECKKELDAHRAQKDKCKPITNRVNKLKKIWKAQNKVITKEEIIEDIGKKQYDRWECCNMISRQKGRTCRRKHHKWQNNTINKLATKAKGKAYYDTLRRIEDCGYATHTNFDRIIKPSTSVYPMDSTQKTKLTINDYTKNDEETANEINRHFNSIGTDKNHNKASVLQTDRKKARELDKEFDFAVINKHHNTSNHKRALKKLLSKIGNSELRYHVMRQKNSATTDGEIHTVIVKKIYKSIESTLNKIVNYYKNTADITKSLSMRAIHPLKKKNKDNEVVKGLRPVSIQNIIWKIYESIINERIMHYLIEMEIISPDQYAIKKGCGAEDYLIDFSYDIHKLIGDQCVKAASFDSSDAFDAQKQEIIYDKFEHHCGFNKQAITLIKSIIKGRTSVTLINGIISEIIETLSGPYQGAVASPTIWCVYVNPLVLYIRKNMVRQSPNYICRIIPKIYMDDITIYSWIKIINKDMLEAYDKSTKSFTKYAGEVQKQMIDIFQQTIDQIKQYLSYNNIPTNDGKTQLITFHERGYKGEEKDDGPWKSFRRHQFKVDGKIKPDNKTFRILGMDFDANWTFELQIKKVLRSMKLIRVRCMALLHSYRNNITIDVLRNMYRSCSFQLLDYAGCIYLNYAQKKDKDSIEVEYNKQVATLTKRCFNAANKARLTFSHIVSFDNRVAGINAKAFSKFIRNNKQNGLYKIKQEVLGTIEKWRNTIKWERYWNRMDPEHIRGVKIQLMEAVNESHPTDFTLRWYIDSWYLQTTDAELYDYEEEEKDSMLLIKDRNFIPNNIPKFIYFNDLTNQWEDKYMEAGKLYALLDGSKKDEGRIVEIKGVKKWVLDPPKSRIHGYGGYAVVFYYNFEIVGRIIYPISSRTHINVMEMGAMRETFQWIDEHVMGTDGRLKVAWKDCQGIEIVTDSQNTYLTLRQYHYPTDEAMIAQHKQICTIFERKYVLPDNFIQIWWVHSHDKSDYNGYVDILAGMAALVARFLGENTRDSTTMLNPNKYIALSTMKSEIRYKVDRMEDEEWKVYKTNTTHSKHLELWKIPRNKNFANDLIYLTVAEVNTLMFVRCNRLPLNFYRFHTARLTLDSENMFCEGPHCITTEGEQLEETMGHFILYCTQFTSQRAILLDKVEMLYEMHNSKVEEEEKEKGKSLSEKKIKFDVTDYETLLKMIIFPPDVMYMDMRVEVLRSLTNYIKHTGRVSTLVTHFA